MYFNKNTFFRNNQINNSRINHISRFVKPVPTSNVFSQKFVFNFLLKCMRSKKTNLEQKLENNCITTEV